MRTNIKFNHIYASSTKHTPSGSDINEDISLGGTERTSELTNERSNDTKSCRSLKPKPFNINQNS